MFSIFFRDYAEILRSLKIFTRSKKSPLQVRFCYLRNSMPKRSSLITEKRNVCRVFTFREKQNWCHLNNGTRQTSPPLQNPNAKGTECEAHSTTGSGSGAQEGGKKNQNQDCNARSLHGSLRRDARQALPVGVAVTGRPGDGSSFHPSPGILGLDSPASYSRLWPQPRLGLCTVVCDRSLGRRRESWRSNGERRALGRPTEDAATAVEAVAAPPPPGRPNCRCDASSGIRARPNRPAGRGQARRPEVAAPGLCPTAIARSRPRARYSARRHRSGRAALR